MVIKQITLWDFGAVSSYTATLTPELNLIDSRDHPELSVAIEFLLGSRTAQRIPPQWVHPDTRLTADIRLDGVVYTVSAFPDNHLLRIVAELGGKDVTVSYRSAVRHCREQDDMEFFDGVDRNLPLRLSRYRERGNIPALPCLSRRTERIADTQTFRACLKQYINTFRPESINNKKRYQLTLNRQGKFEVSHPDYPGEIFLSTTEEKLFHYLCFLNLAEFWEGIEKIRNLHHERKPLLVQNFLEYLDESTDISALLSRTLRLKRQVMILTPPLEEEIKQQWFTQYECVMQKGV